MNLLRSGVAQHLDASLGILFGEIETQAPPSTTEIENAQTFTLTGTLFTEPSLVAIALEHNLLGLGQALFGVFDLLGSSLSRRVFERGVVA